MRLARILFVACLALAVAGCGSSSVHSTSTGPTGGSTAASEAGASTPSTQSTTQPGARITGRGQGGQAGSSGGSGSSGAGSSIQAYGSEAVGAVRPLLAATAFSFFRAMAASDYAKLCAGLSASNRAQLEAFDKVKHRKVGCPVLLKALISTRGAPEARNAAAGKLISVRVKGSTAFVIFKPRGGKPSYFVLKREGGAWKAISLAPGLPLNLPTG